MFVRSRAENGHEAAPTLAFSLKRQEQPLETWTGQDRFDVPTRRREFTNPKIALEKGTGTAPGIAVLVPFNPHQTHPAFVHT